MKRIPAPKNALLKKVIMNVPFVLLITLMTACFGGGLLFAFYSVVSVIAFKSAMIYLIVAGASAILIGIGLSLISAYKKYFAFYGKKIGGKYVDNDQKKEKTVTYADKPVSEIFKKYFTVTNIGIAILALGSVFAIISAALGSIDRANWVSAIGGFKEERGYYTDIKKVDTPTILVNQNTVNISIVQPESNTRKKLLIVIYTKNDYRQSGVTVEGYTRFYDDMNISRSTDGTNENVIVNVGEPPEVKDALGKLLFFMFNDYNAERRIYVYIPYYMRNDGKVSIDAEPHSVLVQENDGTLHDYSE
ncbi:MAG: hypothetical protein NC037_00780 [Bacteroides sp.]|nr:hypothetical protein [Bacillota bacterium]MCM1393447.1 hypothetical protein [[Eubacterium] siraeum]MCM1455053.1 hypothetical protein [Bacteroides sp.]